MVSNTTDQDKHSEIKTISLFLLAFCLTRMTSAILSSRRSRIEVKVVLARDKSEQIRTV